LHAGLTRLQAHSECVMLNAFPVQNGYTNAPECYVLQPLSVLFEDIFKSESTYVFRNMLLSINDSLVTLSNTFIEGLVSAFLK
jgi:hypothetical protein